MSQSAASLARAALRLGDFPSGALVLAAFVLFSSACGPGDADVGPTPGANVVLISIDTLRADHLGLYGYSRATSPRLDELAKRSLVFRRAYAHSANTIVSHASMLTSLYPVSHGARPPDVPLKQSFTTVAEAFRAAGYETAGFTSHPPWLNQRMGFAQGFDSFGTKAVAAERLNQDVFRWLQSRTPKLEGIDLTTPRAVPRALLQLALVPVHPP